MASLRVRKCQLLSSKAQAMAGTHRQGYFIHFIPPPGVAQMGSVTVGAGAAAGVFERESDLLSESRSAMATQVHCIWLRDVSCTQKLRAASCMP